MSVLMMPIRTAQTAAVWPEYRKYRSAIMTLAKLEQHAGIDLHRVRQRGAAAAMIDAWFLAQSFGAMREAAGEAVARLARLQDTMAPRVLDDLTAAAEALGANAPGTPSDLIDAFSTSIGRFGTPRGYLRAVLGMLRIKRDLYRVCERVLRERLRAPVGETIDRVEALIRAAEPGIAAIAKGAGTPEPKPIDPAMARRLAAARERRARALAAGAPAFLANGEVAALVREIALFHPDDAATLIATPTDPADPEPILCFIFGLGWAVCLVVLGLSVASHGVDEDEEEEEEDDGTTGGE